MSAYHAHHKVAAGEEHHPTHFWRWSKTAPWHAERAILPRGDHSGCEALSRGGLLQPNYSLTGGIERIWADAVDIGLAIFRRKTTGQHPVDTAQSNS